MKVGMMSFDPPNDTDALPGRPWVLEDGFERLGACPLLDGMLVERPLQCVVHEDVFDLFGIKEQSNQGPRPGDVKRFRVGRFEERITGHGSYAEISNIRITAILV